MHTTFRVVNGHDPSEDTAQEWTRREKAGRFGRFGRFKRRNFNVQRSRGTRPTKPPEASQKVGFCRPEEGVRSRGMWLKHAISKPKAIVAAQTAYQKCSLSAGNWGTSSSSWDWSNRRSSSCRDPAKHESLTNHSLSVLNPCTAFWAAVSHAERQYPYVIQMELLHKPATHRKTIPARGGLQHPPPKGE